MKGAHGGRKVLLGFGRLSLRLVRRLRHRRLVFIDCGDQVLLAALRPCDYSTPSALDPSRPRVSIGHSRCRKGFSRETCESLRRNATVLEGSSVAMIVGGPLARREGCTGGRGGVDYERLQPIGNGAATLVCELRELLDGGERHARG